MQSQWALLLAVLTATVTTTGKLSRLLKRNKLFTATFTLICSPFLVSYCYITAAIGVATASIDLGYEWIKIGLVKVRSPETDTIL